MNVFFSLIAGLVFGLGLIISGMANPAKVHGFLDVAGAWDPSLALVMLGGILVASIGFLFARKRSQSWLGLPLQMPIARDIDRRLVLGSLLFGIGWGLAGICPGPALVLVGAGVVKGGIFALAMLSGMVLFELVESNRKPPVASAAATNPPAK
ncbi:MAG: YeeE/YedE family protein [Rugosibacter sp.]|nr:MAG: YeeE/YedE family protein [Rugosibacter sp.]